VARELTNRRPYSVRIQRGDEWTRVYEPSVAGDSLRGILHSGIHDHSIGVPINSVGAVQVRAVRPIPTILFGGTVAGIIVLAYLMNRNTEVYDPR